MPLRKTFACFVFCTLFTCSTGTTAASEPGESHPAFQVESSVVHTLRSETLQRSYEIYVKLPPGYDKPENAQRRYPVIYLNDGPYTFQVASGVTRVPFNQQLFEEFILVGISYAIGEIPADSRRRDMTPVVDRSKPGLSGGARAYLDFLKAQVIPTVEKTWRVDATRRSLSGQSYGGLFGLWVAFSEPELFQNYILTSSSLWFGKRAMFDTERDYARSHRDLKARIFLAVGARERPGLCGHPECEIDMVADQTAMAQRLQSRHYPNLKLSTQRIADAYHETTFPVGLLWAMQQLFMPFR